MRRTPLQSRTGRMGRDEDKWNADEGEGGNERMRKWRRRKSKMVSRIRSAVDVIQ